MPTVSAADFVGKRWLHSRLYSAAYQTFATVESALGVYQGSIDPGPLAAAFDYRLIRSSTMEPQPHEGLKCTSACMVLADIRSSLGTPWRSCVFHQRHAGSTLERF